MNWVEDSLFFGLFLSLIGYEIGLLMRRKWKKAIFNPLLISIIVVMLALKVLRVPYESYNMSAKYLSYLLTPSTICLAVPLYEQIDILKQNAKAIICGILMGH